MKPHYSPTDIQNMRVICYNVAAHWLHKLDEDTPVNHYEASRLAEEYLHSYIQAGVTYDELDKSFDISDMLSNKGTYSTD